MERTFFWFGVVSAALVGVVLVGLLLALLGALLARRGPPLAGCFLFLVALFRSVLDGVGRLFGDGRLAEHAGIALANRIWRRAYERVPRHARIAVLPQCLRSLDCPASIDPREGIKCRSCGGCVIGRLRERFPDVRVFVTPGGTFATRVVRQAAPEAVLGVACANDLYEGMLFCHRRGLPVQGVELLRDGCVSTAVDEDVLFERISTEAEDVASD